MSSDSVALNMYTQLLMDPNNSLTMKVCLHYLVSIACVSYYVLVQNIRTIEIFDVFIR